MTLFTWHEIADVPAAPGVYAWYYTPEITAFDLQRVTEQVNQLKQSREPAAAKAALTEFLNECIFRYFREQPFLARLTGPLKPRYEGPIGHKPSMSDSLLDRLVDNPARLATIQAVLEASAPDFASPLYIGMSEQLRTRLGQHKALIERFGELPTYNLTEQGQRDQSFAQEIRTRNIPPTRLFAVVTVIPGAHGTYVDCENILNRIHFPLLGRN